MTDDFCYDLARLRTASSSSRWKAYAPHAGQARGHP